MKIVTNTEGVVSLEPTNLYEWVSVILVIIFVVPVIFVFKLCSLEK